ncbi:MAG TPA: CHAT domain-containing protein [Gemmatimonadales bacterium]|nr:CHAT domain-containing protein [Gemmatimonadales bacterium]
MIQPILALALAFAAVQASNDPGAVVRHATAAVRGDSVSRIGPLWESRLSLDSTDRGAGLGLATIARLTYNRVAAERLYRRLATGHDLWAVYARLGLAQAFEDYGSMAEVDGLLTKALDDARAHRNRAAEGEALTWLGYARARSHGLETALAYYDSALRVLPPEATALVANARCRRAHYLIVLGRGDQAKDLAEASAAARRELDARVEAPCIRARAIALGHRGRGDSAAMLYADYADRLERVKDRSGRALVLSYRGALLREELADYVGAREVLLLARAEARAAHDQYTSAVVQLYLGQLFLSLNDTRAAAGYLDEAVAAAGEVADSEVIMVSRSWRALASLQAGDLARARQESLETLEFFRKEGDVENQSEVAQTLANISIREGDWAAAEAALDTSEALLRRLGVPRWRQEQPFERGRLALYRGDLPAARRGFERHLATLDSADHLARYDARSYLADTYARQGNLAAAERELAAAADDIDHWRAGLGDRDLRVAAFQANATAQNDRNAGVTRAIAALAGGGRAEAAFALAERRRARELIDRLLQNAALERGRSRLGALPRRVERVSAAEIASALPGGTALLEYVTGALGAPTTLFVVTRGRRGRAEVRAHVLPPADSLAGPIGRLLALVTRGEMPAEARALGQVLLGPALAGLGPGISRLIVVPDGALHRVPWDALVMEDGRHAVERFAIGVTPSAALLGALRQRTNAGLTARPARLLAFGDPVFPRDTGSGIHQAFAAAGGLPRLPGSGREVREITRYSSGAEVRLRGSASESWLKRARLSAYGIIHFATHAVVDDRISVRTALALAPGDGEDGFVTPGELAGLRLGADLVVLSACRTAGGVVVDGEGVQGLTAPLLEAGARSIVATTWRVGDERTVGLIGRLYRELAVGASVGDALRAAKLDALRKGEPAAGWAAFTVVGDPSVTVPLRKFARVPVAP